MFFLDRCLPQWSVRSALLAADAEVVCHDDRYEADCADETWLRETAEKGWFVLTADNKIRRKPNEKAALVDAKAAVFVVRAKHLRSADYGPLIVRHLTQIRRIASREERPFVAAITRSQVDVRERFR